MTDSIVGIMQKIAEREAEKIYTTELGIVTAVFPHASAGDKDNYQVSVKLKNRKRPDGSAFELRKVPVTTPHIGLANIPNVDDLVLIAFVGGDINAPVVIGRLYNDEDRPPVNEEKEVLLQHSPDKESYLKLANDGSITLATDNQQVTITIENGGITIATGNNPVTIESSGEIKIGDASTSQIKIGGRALANAVGDGDDIMLSTHTHLGNLGAPCPVLIPNDKINSVQAKTRNTQVG